MYVRSERFDEASLPKPDSTHEYRYKGMTYVAAAPDGPEFIFRVYDEEPTVANMIAPTTWSPDWLESPRVREVFRLLQQRAGVRSLRLYNRLSGTFADVVPMPAEDVTLPDAAT